MDIKFLGEWSSHIMARKRNVSFILDDTLVFDFGPHTLESILEKNIDAKKIRYILISHMHLDHYLGLSEFLWYRSINRIKEPLIIIGTGGIKENTLNLLKTVNTPESWFKDDIDYIDFHENNTDFIEIYKGNHIIPDNGYRVEYRGKTVFYSGDTAYSDSIVKGSEDIDYLFHEMTYLDVDKNIADYWHHSYYSNVINVFKESRAKYLIPIHLTEDTESYIKNNPVKNMIYPDHDIEL